MSHLPSHHKVNPLIRKGPISLGTKSRSCQVFFSPCPSDKSWRQKETSPVSHSEVLRLEWQPCWGTLNARSIQIQMMVRKEWRRGGVPGVTRHCSKWILPHPMIILLPSVSHPMKSSVWLLGRSYFVPTFWSRSCQFSPLVACHSCLPWGRLHVSVWVWASTVLVGPALSNMESNSGKRCLP